MLGQHRRPEALEAGHLGSPIVGREVEVHPVLARLHLSDSAKGEVLDTETGCSQSDELVPILADLAARGVAPELGQAPGLGTVERHVSDEEAHGLTLEERTFAARFPGIGPVGVTERRSKVSAVIETESRWVTRRPAPAPGPFIDGYVGYRLTGLSPGVPPPPPVAPPTCIVGNGGPDRPVAHSELRWSRGERIMLGSASAGKDPDGLVGQATAAGAAVARGPEDDDYGSRGFTVSDPEGKRWRSGTYRRA